VVASKPSSAGVYKSSKSDVASAKGRPMTVEQFQKAFRREVDAVLSRVQRRYNVGFEELSEALHSSAKKYLGDTIEQTTGNPGPAVDARKAAAEFFDSVNADDLCLAIACASGDDTAWEDFYRDYRGYLTGVARTMTAEAGAAEQLADSTFAELYGLRESAGVRVSKFSFYSGRGSLKGWLRAVVFQLSADHHRQTSRLVQTEEPEDIDRLAVSVDKPNGGGSVESKFEANRYRAAVADALGSAIGGLEPRERLLLSYYYYDELTLREIGLTFEVHEATISRWLTKVQKRIRKLLERTLAKDHGLNRTQISEAIEMAAQELDFNVRQYVVGPTDPQPKRETPAEPAGVRWLENEGRNSAS
jgi:RNA polymerase sigma-70 factor